ncbi:MAG: NAD(+)/NADH kinase [Gemmatimonadales bacterium]|nr:NAD(+)/NADH kinase [Gemmatimonadales bacterium]
MSSGVEKTGKGMQCLGLFANPGKTDLMPAINTIQGICLQAGVRVLVSEDLEVSLPFGWDTLPNQELVECSDTIVALGGDGTMLRAARILCSSGVPLLGINLGSLGYLTDVPLKDLDSAVRRLLAGEYHLETRSRVCCSVLREGQRVARHHALNDLVVNMGPLPRALDMELLLDDFPVGKFLGDGLIVSTPTGSTAYNLSAGGPICHGTIPGLLVTPICPHSLAMRPVIVSSSTKIELILHETGEGAALAADGQIFDVLENGDRLEFGQSELDINLVKFPHSNFYKVMRHKLNWGGRHRSSLKET